MDGAAPNPANAYWADDESELVASLESSRDGLSSAEAGLRRAGRPESSHRRRTQLVLMLRQFTTPITLILILATLLSAALGETVDAVIILAIVIPSGLLSFSQEYGASRAMEELVATVGVRVRVRRDGTVATVLPADIV